MEIYEIEEGKMVHIIFVDFFVCFAFPIWTLNQSLRITLLSHCLFMIHKEVFLGNMIEEDPGQSIRCKFENTLLFFQSYVALGLTQDGKVEEPVLTP